MSISKELVKDLREAQERIAQLENANAGMQLVCDGYMRLREAAREYLYAECYQTRDALRELVGDRD